MQCNVCASFGHRWLDCPKGNKEMQQKINNKKEAEPKTIEKLIVAFLYSGLIKHDKKN